jgi:hypothetical protein
MRDMMSRIPLRVLDVRDPGRSAVGAIHVCYVVTCSSRAAMYEEVRLERGKIACHDVCFAWN